MKRKEDPIPQNFYILYKQEKLPQKYINIFVTEFISIYGIFPNQVAFMEYLHNRPDDYKVRVLIKHNAHHIDEELKSIIYNLKRSVGNNNLTDDDK